MLCVPFLSQMTSISDSYSTVTATRVEPIADIIKRLEIISCDSCEEKLASYDVYVDSGIAGTSFLRRCCSDCIQIIHR